MDNTTPLEYPTESNLDKLLADLKTFANIQGEYLKAVVSPKSVNAGALVTDTSKIDYKQGSNLEKTLNSIKSFAEKQTEYLAQLVGYSAIRRNETVEQSVASSVTEKRTSFVDTAKAKAGNIVGGGFGLGSLLENLGGSLGGSIGNIAGLGVGLAGLFVSLAGADWAIKKLGDGASLKNLIINLGEGLSSLDAQGLTVLGTLLASSAGIALFTSPGKDLKTGIGMGLIGAGIGAFIAGLALAPGGLGGLLGIDGSALKAQLSNLGEGLSAFNSDGLNALGILLASSAGIALFGVGASGNVAVGLGLIGTGIGAFIAGLVGTTEVAAALGADGAGLKTQLINIAGGMDALGNVNWTNVGTAGTALISLGAGMAAFLGASGLGAIGNYAADTIDSIKGFSNWLFGTDFQTSDTKSSAIQQIVDSLAPINTLDDSMIQKMDDFGAAISRFVGSFESLSNLKAEGISTNLGTMLKGIGALLDAQDKLINGGTWEPTGTGRGWLSDIGNISFGPEGTGGLRGLTDENIGIIKEGVTKLYGALNINPVLESTQVSPSAPEKPSSRMMAPPVVIAPTTNNGGSTGPVNSNNTTTTIINRSNDSSSSLMMNTQMLGSGLGDLPM